jgi:hypothetical protein
VPNLCHIEAQIGDYWRRMVTIFIVDVAICRRGFLLLANPLLQPLAYLSVFQKLYIFHTFFKPSILSIGGIFGVHPNSSLVNDSFRFVYKIVAN